MFLYAKDQNFIKEFAQQGNDLFSFLWNFIQGKFQSKFQKMMLILICN